MSSGKVARRQFLTAAVGATALGATGLGASALGEARQVPESVKFSVFADFHHFPGVFLPQTPEYLEAILSRAEREDCDFIIHCGDFTHNPPAVRAFVERYNTFHIPTFHTLGNHDQDGCPWEESLAVYGMSAGHYFFDRGGFRFIVTDPNYFREDGVCTHYTSGNYYKYRGPELSVLPPEQMEWLEQTLTGSPYPCVVFSHQSLEREVGGVANGQQFRDLVDRVNRETPGRVRLCINGHHHRDNLRILNRVVYFDLNSASYDWVEKEHDRYPRELTDANKLVNHVVAYTDPIHAVITLGQDGTLKIAGMESRMFMGVTRRDIGAKFADGSGRPVYPRVQSVEMRLF